ncbi:MAG: beta-galactosidase trimerization domain-containing protein, partial [Clostridia bacterium]|nr:beta-galactosidase trimerization domain-containing protein [Clostridia bacterium]
TEAKVGLLFDWDNLWMLENACGFQNDNKKVMPTIEKFYYALWRKGIDVDIIDKEDDFTQYDLIVAPMLYSVPEALGRKLKQFVAEGGKLVGTYTTAMVNEIDLCYRGGFPGAGLREVFGIWNEEIDTLYPEDRNVIRWDDKDYAAIDYCEILHSEGAEVLATYGEDFYKGFPAVTRNAYGKGEAYYIAFRDEGDFAADFLENLLQNSGIHSAFDGPLPYGVTAHSRTDGETLYVFVQNYSHNTHTLQTNHTWVTTDEGLTIQDTFTLAPYETVILQRKK